MCFDQKSSAFFAVVGLSLSIGFYIWLKNLKFSIGVFYFFGMELLQAIQYSFIDQCDNPINKFLTLVGYLHICFQPFFMHLMSSSCTVNRDKLLQFRVVYKLTFAWGLCMILRFLLAPYSIYGYSDSCNTEWVRGESLCTYKGNVHLAWSVPLYDDIYISPNLNVHFMLMIVPYFLIDWKLIFSGIILTLTGPVLSMLLTDNVQEQPSIWCFFSIAQIICLSVTFLLVHGLPEKQDDSAQPRKQSKKC